MLSDYVVGGQASLTWMSSPEPVLRVTGTHMGLLVFLWAYGFRNPDPDQIRLCAAHPVAPPGPTFGRFDLAPYRTLPI
jgi:hypothetical protein